MPNSTADIYFRLRAAGAPSSFTSAQTTQVHFNLKVVLRRVGGFISLACGILKVRRKYSCGIFLAVLTVQRKSVVKSFFAEKIAAFKRRVRTI